MFHNPENQIITASGIVEFSSKKYSALISGTLNGLSPDPDSWTMRIDFDDKQIFDNSDNAGNIDVENVKFIGTDLNGNDLLVEEIVRSKKTTSYIENRRIIEGPAQKIFIGDNSKTAEVEGSFYFYIHLNPSILTSCNNKFTKSYDGTVRLETDLNKGIIFSIDDWEGSLIDSYTYIDGKVGIYPVTNRIQKSILQIKFAGNGGCALPNYFELLSLKIDNCLELLSFLNRKRVFWFAYENLFIDTNRQNIKSTFCKKYFDYGRSITDEKPGYLFNLAVDFNYLVDGGFNQLLNSLENHKHKREILRAISLIVMTYETRFLEEQLGHIYGAIECLVKTFLPMTNIEPITDKNLISRLQNELKNVVNNLVLDKKVAKTIISRLSNINNPKHQPGFSNRVIQVINSFDVPLDQIYKPKTDIEKELEGSNFRRHAFIHKALLKNPSAYYFDLFRYRCICELLILKALGVPDKAINKAGISPYYRLNEI